MKPLIKLTIIIAVVLISQASNSQITPERGGVTFGDSIFTSGEVSFNPLKPTEVKFRRAGQEFVTYKAGEVTSFIIHNYDEYEVLIRYDSHEYAAINVTIDYETKKKAFVKVLEKGKTNLYKSNIGVHRYYIGNDSLVSLTRSNYNDVLKNFAQPSENNLYKNHKRVRYNDNSLSYFFREYNKGNIHVKMPMSKIGVSFQINYTTFNFPKSNFIRKLKEFNMNSVNPSLGLLYNQVFWRNPIYSIEFYFAYQFGESIKTVIAPTPKDYIKEMDFDYKFLQLDITPQRKFDLWKINPTISAGMSSRYTYHSKDKIFFVNTRDGILTSYKLDNFYDFPSYFLGYTIKTGFQYYILPIDFLSMDIGFSQLWGFKMKGYSLKNKFISFKIAF